MAKKHLGGVPGGEQCERCHCGRVATGAISQVVSETAAAGRAFFGKALGAKKKRMVFCFSVCFCVSFSCCFLVYLL